MWAAFIDGEPIALRIGTEAGYVNMLTQPVEGGDR
jgi:hypothetical protein